MTCRSSSDSIISSLELEKARLRRAHPDWSDEQVRRAFSRHTEHVLSYLMDHSETPRSLQQDLADGSGLKLACAGSWVSSDSDLSTVDFDYTDSLVPVPMARHTLSTPSFLGCSPTPRSISDGSTGSKRDYHQIDMAPSASYTYGSDPSRHMTSSMALSSSMVLQNPETVQSYEPAEYMLKLSGDIDCETEPSISKRQRLEDVSDALPYAIATAHNLNPSFDVMPSLSGPTTLLSPCAPSLGESMNRQSNMTNSSLSNRVDMLRLGSFSSVASGVPSVSAGEDLEHSFLLCANENPADARSLNMPLLEDGDSRFFCELDEGSTKFPYFTVGQIFPSAVSAQTQPAPASVALSDGLAEEMERSDSDRSMTSTTSTASTSSADSARQKDIDRRRKHIENGKQAIAMKSLPSGPKSTSPSANINARPTKALETSSKCKEPIAKAPYVRPLHPKLFCDQCDKYPDGFKGDHELRRHRDRAHATRRKVWICTQPSKRTGPWPESPLNICKYCRNGKTFNVDYNAAAHLRRCHFFPCKRGRKPRGDPRESRAGKAGGDQPPIDWLKDNGWLTEIEVTVPPPEHLSPEEALPEAGSFPPAELGIEYSADALGFGPAATQNHEDDLMLSASLYEAPQQYSLYCSNGADEARTVYHHQSPCVEQV